LELHAASRQQQNNRLSTSDGVWPWKSHKSQRLRALLGHHLAGSQHFLHMLHWAASYADSGLTAGEAAPPLKLLRTRNA